MGQSYRIRTELGITKTINVQLDQEFEQLEILSLKIQQEDVYNRKIRRMESLKCKIRRFI